MGRPLRVHEPFEERLFRFEFLNPAAGPDETLNKHQGSNSNACLELSIRKIYYLAVWQAQLTFPFLHYFN